MNDKQNEFVVEWSGRGCRREFNNAAQESHAVLRLLSLQSVSERSSFAVATISTYCASLENLLMIGGPSRKPSRAISW